MDGAGYSSDPLDTGWKAGAPTTGSLFRSARRQAWLVACCVAVSAAAGLSLIVLSEPHYTAQVAFELEPGSGALVDTPIASAMDLATHVELLRSEPVTAGVIRQLDLGELPEFAPQPGILQTLVTDLRARLGYVPPAGSQAADPPTALVRAVAEGLNVARVGETRVVELGYRSPSPSLAADIANTYAHIYVDGIAAEADATTARRIERLNARADDMHRRAAEAETRIQGILQDANRLFADPLDPQAQAAELRQQLSALEVRSAALAARRSLIAAYDQTGDPSALPIDTPESRLVLKDLATAEDRLAVIRDTPDAAPAVRETLERGVEALRSSLRQEVRLAAEATNAELGAAEAERASVLDQLARVRDFRASDAWAALEAARSEKAHYQRMHEDYLTRVEETRREPRSRPELRIVADAPVPMLPTSPDATAVLAIALTLGTFLGLGVAALREWNRHERLRR